MNQEQEQKPNGVPFSFAPDAVELLETSSDPTMRLSEIEAALIREFRQALADLNAQARGAMTLMLRSRGLPKEKNYAVSEDGTFLTEQS